MKKLYLATCLLLYLYRPDQVRAQTLVHYWNFNNSATEAAILAPTFTAGDGVLTYVNGATSQIQITSNTGNGFETLNENARNGDLEGTHLRYTNSVDGTLLFSLPTNGYENVVLKYTTRRSSAGNGAGVQVVDYSTDGSTYTNFTSINTEYNAPVLQTLDFSALSATDNNPNFKIRITFQQGAGGVTGNNRFDNFTLDGTSLQGDETPPAVTFSPVNNTAAVAVSVASTLTFNEDIRLANNTALNNTNVDNVVELRLSNGAGAAVPFDATIAGRVVTLTPSAPLQNSQTYYVALKGGAVEDLSDNAIVSVQSASFTTISEQTQFNKGDLVFVAYRANASSSDEVAFLTFVDILPGTQINFTDGKFTDNGQCSGGFVWTAPAEGVTAGSVISISVDSPFSTNTGTVTGSSFGLSSGGDQVIVYTGTAASPSHVTALSTNGWITTSTTACGGSLSKIPAGLVDGQTSLNMSTSPGNTSGNTVNAYYSGPQTGTNTALRTAILNPANWVGVGSGTDAQLWPTWAFPGAPYVTNASVASQTTLKIVFSSALDNATATNKANYTGIAGLQTATLDGKTVTLTYTTPFAGGSNNALVIADVKDTEGRVMAKPYTFNFTYTTFISFDKKFVTVQEGAGSVSVKIKVQNPATGSIDLVAKGSPFSSASETDFTFTSQTLNFTGVSPAEQTIVIPITDDQTQEQDEYIVLALDNASGTQVSGGNYMTIFIKDNDRKAPQPTKEIEITHVGSFNPGASTAEIVVHDPESQRLFVISSIQDRLDIADFSDPADIKLIKSIDMKPYGGITSVATKNGIVAVASPDAVETEKGSAVFFTADGDYISKVTVGVLPDMITFSPDGKIVMTANEGQPNDAYTIDPEGSVSIIDLSGGVATLDQSKAKTLSFVEFNNQEAALIASGVRKLKASSTLSQDFEPEYITIAADSRKAWVTLQENNAIGEIDLQTQTITSVWPLGKKDFNAFGNGLDASDNSGVVTIANWPVKGFYIPDGIANYTVDGTSYLVTANEGDEKEYSGLAERTTVADVKLDPTVFPNEAVLKESHNIGRLRMTKLSGDTDGDGDYDEINIPGGRSFTIWNATTKTKVFDSGDDFERFTSTDPSVAPIFNADNENNTFKSRSRAKGPEPEGIAIASINDKKYAFVALERVGGVMVYDITDPTSVKFVDYKNSRSLVSYSGDFGPEGIIFISRENSPDDKAYIAVANEISGTVSVFEILPVPKRNQSITFEAPGNKNVSDAAFGLQASASSGLPVSFSTTDDEVTLAGNQVTPVKGGYVTIVANQNGDDTYAAAVPAIQSFCVNPAKPTITLVGEFIKTPTLKSSALEDSQWFKDGVAVDGAVEPELVVTEPGMYTVKTIIEGCESSPSEGYSVIVTGVEQDPAIALSIHPNPTTDRIRLTLPGNGAKQVRIYQASGAFVETRTTSESELEIDVQPYGKGYYLVNVITSAGNYHGKFVRK